MENCITFESIEKLLNSFTSNSIENLKNEKITTLDEAFNRTGRLADLREVIKKLTNVSNIINEFVLGQEKVIHEIVSEHEKKVNTIKSTINKEKSEKNILGRVDVTYASKANGSNTQVLVKENFPKPAINGKPIMRPIAEGVTEYAFTISNPNDCINHKGYLCWCEKDKIFYFTLNDVIIPLSTTYIHGSGEANYKVIEHRDAGKSNFVNIMNNPDSNQYYVPPELHPSSHDIRNLPNEFRFYPASSGFDPIKKYSFRIGSKHTLCDDLKTINDVDARFFIDLIRLLFLPMLVLKKQMDKRKSS